MRITIVLELWMQIGLLQARALFSLYESVQQMPQTKSLYDKMLKQAGKEVSQGH